MTDSIKKLTDTADKAVSEGNLDLLKEAAREACECCRTRIDVTVSNSRELIRPLIVSDEDRSACVAVYGRCTAAIKEKDRFYIPDQIERERPDRGRLLFLMRKYLSERSSTNIQAQQAGTSFNRLFGSRG